MDTATRLTGRDSGKNDKAAELQKGAPNTSNRPAELKSAPSVPGRARDGLHASAGRSIRAYLALAEPAGRYEAQGVGSRTASP